MTLAIIAIDSAFCAALAALSSATVALMVRVGVKDVPGDRSSHTRPTPKGGGVGVVLAFLVGAAVLYRFAGLASVAGPYFPAVVLAATGVAVVAFLDDLLSWPFFVKLGAQVLAALVVVCAGMSVTLLRVPWLGTLDLGWLGPMLTFAWIVVATNAMNFIDGLNGLAAGVTCLACFAIVVIAGQMGAQAAAAAALLLMSGVLGFLPFNFPRARIFMGDVGSQFCGFLLASFAVMVGRSEHVELSVLLVPMLLAGVLFDVVYTLLRRLMAGDRISEAHRTHLYQLAQQSGMPAFVVTLVHWGFTAWGATCCSLLLHAHSEWKPFWVAAVLPPQLGWLLLVDHLACRHRVLRPVLRLRHSKTG